MRVMMIANRLEVGVWSWKRKMPGQLSGQVKLQIQYIKIEGSNQQRAISEMQMSEQSPQIVQ